MSKLITRILLLLVFANLVFEPFGPLSIKLVLWSFVAMFALLVVYYFQEYIMSKKKREEIAKETLVYSLYCCHLRNDSSRSLERGYLCISSTNFIFVEKTKNKIVFKRPISSIVSIEPTKIALRKGYNFNFASLSEDSEIFTLTGSKLVKDQKIAELLKK